MLFGFRSVPYFRLFKICSSQLLIINRQLHTLLSTNKLSFNKLFQIYESEVKINVENSNIEKVIFDLIDVPIEIDDLIKCNENIKNNSAFWFLFINYTKHNKLAKASNSLVNYFVSQKQMHSNNTLFGVIVILRQLGRFDDFKILCDFVLPRLDSTEQQCILPNLLREISLTPYWRQCLDFMDLLNIFSINSYDQFFLSSIEFDSMEEIAEFLQMYSHLISKIKLFHFEKLSQRIGHFDENQILFILTNLFNIMQKDQTVVDLNLINKIENIFSK